MTDLQYDASALFDIMPSFWRSYPDRQVLETVYGAYLRLADADYASLFTDDDNKDLFSLQGTPLPASPLSGLRCLGDPVRAPQPLPPHGGLARCG